MSERPEIVLKLTRSLARTERRDPLALRLCHAVVEIVDAADGAISLGFRNAGRTHLCATSDRAARFEDAQELVREGPSLDAYRTAGPVTSLTSDDRRRRWPGLTEVLGDLELGAVHALPMRPAATVLGVLTVHHVRGLPAKPLLPELQFLADAIGAAIIGELPGLGARSPLWSERDQVSQATGMVVAQLDLDPPDALAVLRAHAFAEASTVLSVSRRVIARDLDFTPPRDASPEAER